MGPKLGQNIRHGTHKPAHNDSERLWAEFGVFRRRSDIFNCEILACALGGVGSPVRPFARPPDRPETCENHKKTTEILEKQPKTTKTYHTIGKRPKSPSPVRPSLRAGQDSSAETSSQTGGGATLPGYRSQRLLARGKQGEIPGRRHQDGGALWALIKMTFIFDGAGGRKTGPPSGPSIEHEP